MRARWIGVSWLVTAAAAMFLQACAPQVTGPDGEASQADKEADPGGDGDTGGDHEGGCDAEPGPVCTGVPIGDQATCVSPDDLLVAAQGACAAEGLIAVDVSPSWNCEGGQSSFAKVLCCDSGAPAGVPVQPPDPGPSPAGGLLEISTASLIDWPQQGRLLELLDDGAGGLVVASTVIDHAGTWTAPLSRPGDTAAQRAAAERTAAEQLHDPLALAGLSRLLAGNDYRARRHPDGLDFMAGSPEARNTVWHVRRG